MLSKGGPGDPNRLDSFDGASYVLFCKNDLRSCPTPLPLREARGFDDRCMMFYCHLLALFLLGVDWMEDPHQGQFAYSCPMRSSVYAANDSDLPEIGALMSTPLLEQPVLRTMISFASSVLWGIRITLFAWLPQFDFMSLQL
jgi:hypothetical protein